MLISDLPYFHLLEMNVRVRIIILGLIAFLSVSTKCFNPGADHGEYMVINGPLTKFHDETPWLKFDAELVKTNCWDKVISANITIFKKLTNIGIEVHFKKLDKNGYSYEKNSPNLKLDNACDAGFGTSLFMEKFKPVDEDKDSINLKKCSIDPGDFLMRNFEVEPHIKEGLGKNFFWGDFCFEVNVFGVLKNGTRVDYISVGINLSIVNREMEEQRRKTMGCKGNGMGPPRHGKRSRSRNKNGSENKEDDKDHHGKKDHSHEKDHSDEEKDVKDPETWSDPDSYQNSDNWNPKKYGA